MIRIWECAGAIVREVTKQENQRRQTIYMLKVIDNNSVETKVVGLLIQSGMFYNKRLI